MEGEAMLSADAAEPSTTGTSSRVHAVGGRTLPGEAAEAADIAARNNICIDFSQHPGTQFQNHFLENFRCPIVRPLATSTPPVRLWIAQTNSSSLVSPGHVAKALDFLFCASPESFSVQANLPHIFYTSVANEIVRFHLLKIGVFAMDGIIFHFHPDRHSAACDVIASAACSGEPGGHCA